MTVMAVPDLSEFIDPDSLKEEGAGWVLCSEEGPHYTAPNFFCYFIPAFLIGTYKLSPGWLRIGEKEIIRLLEDYWTDYF